MNGTICLQTTLPRVEPNDCYAPHNADLPYHIAPSYQSVAFWNDLSVGPIYEGVSKPHKGSSGSVCPRAEEGAMLRNRFLILLGVSFLAASAALADDIGFIDCSKNADGAQVFAKPRRSPDVVASLPCGERFTILVYGFVFSRIQTSDGKVGFVYSSVIAVDRSGASVQQTSSPRMVTASDKVAVKSAPAAQPAQPAPAQTAPASASVAATQAPAPLAPAATTAEASASVVQPTLPTPAQPQPVAAQPAPAPASEPGSPSSTMPAPAPPTPASSAPESAAPAAQPEPLAAAQPEPAQPAAPAIRPAEVRSTWESRNPGGVRRTPLIEVFGGYAFARLDGGGGYWTNMNVGGMGSVGWNFKPWLQIVADSSYSTVTISGTKNVLYGNHFGPRYFYHNRNRWGVTPFVEGLVGGLS